MKILCWNTRGLKGINKKRLVKECVTSAKPDVVVLFQEIKKPDVCTRFIRSIVGHCLDEWVSFLA